MEIMILVVPLLLGLLPSFILYKWFMKKNEDENYKKIYKDAFWSGFFSSLIIIITSLIFVIIGKVLGIKQFNPLLYQAYYTFIVLALSEELVKFLTFKHVIRKNKLEYSWYNITIIMTIVGLGFGFIENILTSVGSGIIVMLIRGLTMGHAGYGFIMGWFYGKMLKTKKKIYGVLSFLIPWLLHGFYDFGLSDELLAISDDLALISVSLAFVCLICVFLIIRFVRKKRNDNVYTTPIVSDL